jgi:Domain of unknown function (DUF4382)
MNSRTSRVLIAVVAVLPLLLWGCGSNSSTSNSSGTPSGQLSMMVSDDPSNDWAIVGVTVLSVSLKPQGGGAPVVVFTAPTPAPMINLVQLDQLAEIIGNVSVPAGTYTGATLTLSANPGDVVLTASADPDPGFAGTPGATVPSSQIQIQGANGSAGSRTVPLNVTFDSPLVVTANQNNALDLEFDLAHPAFIVAHVPPTSGQVIWAVNFNGPFRHRPIRDITRLVLRQIYGSFNSISSDNSSISITRVFPTEPPVTPETSVSSSQTLTILADKTNGTLFYDMDLHTHSTIMNFANLGGELNGKFLRVAARYQADGSLVAVRIWASSSFNTIFLSPEGHVLHVLSSSLVVDSDAGTPVTVNVDANTQFFFRMPSNAAADVKPICTGTACLTSLPIVRGFKVHVDVNPLQNSTPADTVDIEIAHFDGSISSPGMNNFTYTRRFANAADNYSLPLTYISNSTPNGKDPLSGAAILGFKWWNFAFPTIVDSGTNAIPDFISATGGSVNFGGSVGALAAVGTSNAVWADSANPNGWSVPSTILLPVPAPLATVSAQWVTTNNTGSFSISVPGGTPVVVDANVATGSATLVYQVDRQSNGIITVSPQDLTTPAGLNNVASHLVGGTPVKVFGVPQKDGSVKAYVFFYFTGMAPTS